MNEKPPLPNSYLIPQPIIDQWVQIPATEQLTALVTRGDVDRLFFAINNLALSQSELQSALVEYSNGNLDGANTHLDMSRRNSIEGVNSLRAFLASVMSAELKSRAGRAG